MVDLAEAYAETKAHLAKLARSLPAERLATIVPASPDWSVQDVVAHVTGVARDVVTAEAAPALNVLEAWRDTEQALMRDELTARQVASRRGRPLEEVLAEWDANEAELLPMIRGERPFPFVMPFIDRIVVTDLAVHAQDVRGAVGMPGDRESAGVGVAFGSYAGGVDLKLRALGMRALRLAYGEKERILGDGEAAATWSAERFDLFRALAGRRSRDQILAMGWEGNAEPYLPLIPAYGERFADLVE